jgi:hypothetical protein
MIDDVPPGRTARLSAVETRLGHGRLRLYATEDIPSETDDSLLALLAAIEGLPLDDRTAAGRQLSETIAWGLRVFAVRMATRAVRTLDTRFIRSGLHALALEVAPGDPRDFFVAVAPLFHASERLGMDSAAIFNEAAGFAPSQVSDFIRAFPRRRPETRRLEDFGFHAEGIGSSFRFVDDAPRADDPAVRETMKGLLE